MSDSSKCLGLLLTKAVTKYEGPIFFLAAPKIVSFSQLPPVKKTPFLVQLKNVSPSYFVAALVKTKPRHLEESDIKETSF